MGFEQIINQTLNNYPFIKRGVKRAYQRIMYGFSSKIKSSGDINRVSPDDGSEYFFGYYDKSPWDITDRYMLCMRAKNTWSDVSPKEKADILIIDTSLPQNDTNRVKKIAETLPPHYVAVVPLDSYYNDTTHMTDEERKAINFDHPDAFDTELFLKDLRALKAGKAIQCPIYDYTIHDRLEDTKTVYPAKVIVVEGILIFSSRELCDEMDIRVFVDADADVRILRRIVRDVRDRGRSLDSVVNQYLTTVKPMHEAFVEPSKRRADIIVPEGGHNLVALDMIMERVRAHLEQ